MSKTLINPLSYPRTYHNCTGNSAIKWLLRLFHVVIFKFRAIPKRRRRFCRLWLCGRYSSLSLSCLAILLNSLVKDWKVEGTKSPIDEVVISTLHFVDSSSGRTNYDRRHFLLFTFYFLCCFASYLIGLNRVEHVSHVYLSIYLLKPCRVVRICCPV